MGEGKREALGVRPERSMSAQKQEPGEICGIIIRVFVVFFRKMAKKLKNSVMFWILLRLVQVYLRSGLDVNNDWTGYYESEDFGASETDVAFGRYYKASTDSYNFVAMSTNTPHFINADPKVGPIVINEIMYNPSSDNQDEEYIELYNTSGLPETLYVDVEQEAWKFTDGISFTFPTGPAAVTIQPGGYLMKI